MHIKLIEDAPALVKKFMDLGLISINPEAKTAAAAERERSNAGYKRARGAESGAQVADKNAIRRQAYADHQRARLAANEELSGVYDADGGAQ
tara:strand:+ start:923 stop:1198 length:276 start_codon:yes stop_codon:yes gene_type:complete